MKKQKLKRKNRRKNPYKNETFFDNVSDGIIYGTILDFSRILAYYKTGPFCDDCETQYWDCTCEGDRNGGQCTNCEQNYCVCDYNLDKNSSQRKVRWVILRWIDQNLTDDDKDLILKLVRGKLILMIGSKSIKFQSLAEIVKYLNINNI